MQHIAALFPGALDVPIFFQLSNGLQNRDLCLGRRFAKKYQPCQSQENSKCDTQTAKTPCILAQISLFDAPNDDRTSSFWNRAALTARKVSESILSRASSCTFKTVRSCSLHATRPLIFGSRSSSNLDATSYDTRAQLAHLERTHRINPFNRKEPHAELRHHIPNHRPHCGHSGLHRHCRTCCGNRQDTVLCLPGSFCRRTPTSRLIKSKSSFPGLAIVPSRPTREPLIKPVFFKPFGNGEFGNKYRSYPFHKPTARSVRSIRLFHFL